MSDLRIHVNGELNEYPEGLSLTELITLLELPVQRIAVELNKEVVRRKNWESTVLNDDDRVEIVHFVGGGLSG